MVQKEISFAGQPGQPDQPVPASNHVRGLALPDSEASKFYDVNHVKELLIRNNHCRCMKTGEEGYLLSTSSDLVDDRGQAFARVMGKFRFDGSSFIPHAAFHSFFSSHQVTPTEYDELISKWPDKGGFVGWKLTVFDKIDPPLFVPSKTSAQDCS